MSTCMSFVLFIKEKEAVEMEINPTSLGDDYKMF